MRKAVILAGLALALPLPLPACGEEPERKGEQNGEIEKVAPVTHEAAIKECGACHMPYQPALLPASSWEKIFAGLADHFGDDASLEEPLRTQIRDYYVANAGRYREPAPLRITEMPWWVAEHRDVAQARWTAPEVKFKGNCTACHKQAQQGIYEED